METLVWQPVRDVLTWEAPYATGLLLAAAAVLFMLAMSRAGAPQGTALSLGAFGVLAVGVARLLWGGMWGWALAALPALIVLQHGVYLLRVKPRFVDPRDDGVGLRERVAPFFHREVEDVISSSGRHFDERTITLRYGLATLVLFLLGLMLFETLSPGTRWYRDAWGGRASTLDEGVLAATRLGAMGAYLAVVLHLGARGVRHDISSSSVLGAAATLVAGPILATVAARTFGGTSTPSGATDALYFLAGFFPRVAILAVEEVGSRLSGKMATRPADRTVPLQRVRGMLPPIVDRLGEEGILDVSGLAMADPLKLQRNCNFDKRQILNWIDEALLIHLAPSAWERLVGAEVTGAIDLAWYWDGDAARTARGLKKVAGAADLAPEVMADMACRAFEDAQVRLIWVLYQLETSEVEAGSSSPKGRWLYPVPPLRHTSADPASFKRS